MPRGRKRIHPDRKEYLRKYQRDRRLRGGEELREKERIAAQARRNADPEKARTISNKNKAKARRERPHIHLNQWLWWAYKMKPEQYAKMLERQGGTCAFCFGDNGGKKLLVDHDHSKPKGEGNRWLLCNPCNIMIGAAKENTSVLRAAADKLDVYNGA